MNSYFDALNFNRFSYPQIELISGNFVTHRGIFLIDHTIQLNLIKESELSSFVNINRNNRYTSRQGSIRTRGSAIVEFHDFSLKFEVIDYESDSEIVGVLGASFFDQLFETNYFSQIAEDYDRRIHRRSNSIRERIIRRVCRFLRNSSFRKFP